MEPCQARRGSLLFSITATRRMPYPVSLGTAPGAGAVAAYHHDAVCIFINMYRSIDKQPSCPAPAQELVIWEVKLRGATACRFRTTTLMHSQMNCLQATQPVYAFFPLFPLLKPC